MKAKLLWLLLLLAALLGGCAFQNAIENGNLYVQKQEYRRALSEYERALRLDPDSGEARGLIVQIKPFALNEAEADMKAELRATRYEAAMQHVAYVQRYDAKRGARLTDTVKAQLRTHIEAHMAKGEMAKAYPLALRAAKLFPRMEGLGSVFGRLRQHYYTQSDLHAAAGRYADALAALDVVERHEPHLKESLAPRREKIRGQWADATVAKAVKAEAAEELGAAATLYARAFEIAGRPADADSMRRLVRTLRDDGRFLLSIAYSGDARRSRAIAKLAAPKLTAVEGLAMADGSTAEDGVSMITKVSVGKASCRETHTTSMRSKDYVAGTRQVPNPAYDSLSTEIDTLTTEVNVLSPKVTSKSSQVSQLEGRLKRCERREQEARSHGKDRRQAPDCSSIRSELSSAKSELSSLESQLSSAESKLNSRSSQRASTPRTLTEDVIETFTYEVRHNVRSCGVSMTASLEPAWSGVENHQLGGRGSTEDESHNGYSQYGVPPDGLSFPLSDRDLLSNADRSAASAVAGLVRKKVTSYYRAMTDRGLTLDKEDPVAAIDMLVAIVVAGRTHLDKGRVQKIQARLAARYELASIDTLRK